MKYILALCFLVFMGLLVLALTKGIYDALWMAPFIVFVGLLALDSHRRNP